MATTAYIDDQFHKRLLDQLGTAVLLLDHALMLRYLNPAAEMLLACSAQRLLGQPLPEGLFKDPEALAALARCAADGLSFTRREARLEITSGHCITVDYSVTRLLEQGRPSALLIELQPLDRMLRIAREEAFTHAHQATRALVRGVAHEIKNPLGGIRGAAQLLERALPGAELTEYTRVIIDEADRLRALADRLLGPRRPPRFQRLNVHECLEYVRQLILAEHPSRIQLRRDYDISLPEVPADRDQLIQVLLNLARNAVQALTEANMHEALVIFRTRILRQFTIGAQRHRQVLRIDIEDNGPGIPETLRETLFYPMVSGRAQGTGLGLSIAQAIVSQHQGMMVSDSRAGRTVFSVLLPFEQHAAEAAGESAWA